ncbi:MAG: SRPBCC domain-containing protein [Candidatus Diapherotrites archaeon]|uniref:SRPBCC domain-containing protein n=1 Tax=Candidatus Iainarchaeum sp. TaxID=3101447 RepID=A0A8T3YP82_9ARCH|nr:SRPBCC domain-containing protein [Candidatus Diapherotrites archaeon]
MKTKTIRQSVTFRAAPMEVYDALMDSDKHSAFTQSECKIGRKAGERFTAYDGYCEGENIELVPGRKIVQAWRASDWPEGHYSKAAFMMAPAKGGTKLSFTQTGVPQEFAEEISEGWKQHYWEKMRKMLEK